jgi:hypothetical protein
MTIETAIVHPQGFQEHGMIGQIRKAAQFRALHIPGKPLVLFNTGMSAVRGRSLGQVQRQSQRAVGRSHMRMAMTIASRRRSIWQSTIYDGLSVRPICQCPSIWKAAMVPRRRT